MTTTEKHQNITNPLHAGSLSSSKHHSVYSRTSILHYNSDLFPYKMKKLRENSQFKQKLQNTDTQHTLFDIFIPLERFVHLIIKNFFNFWAMYKSKLLTKLGYLRLVPGTLLMVAIIVTSVNLWLKEAELPFILGGVAAALICILMLYLNYFYFYFEGITVWISHFWWGLLLGSIAFGPSFYRPWQPDDMDKLVDLLLMTSTAVQACCDFLDRFCEEIPYRSQFLLDSEVGAMLGFMLSGLPFLSTRHLLDLFFITLASAFVLINLRMKCTMAFFFFFLFVAISAVTVFDNFNLTFNNYALVCFYSRLFLPSAIDFYFSPLSALERWNCSFELSCLKQFASLSFFFLVETGFCLFAFYVIVLHPEYELVFVVPVVSASGLLWICTHFAYVTTEITLSRKLNECQQFFHKLPSTSCGTNLSHVMSSKGVRLLCFVGQQTVACALLSTFLFGAVSWRREDATYPSLLLLIIGIESASFGRVRELAVKLGGTCAAYALITPTTKANPNAPITILPVDSLQKQNERATSLITSMHRFFALYLIENLGCDYSTMGTGFCAVEEKIKNLFSKRTKSESGDGARYDTYIFYYSGLSSDDGSLVLGDGAVLSPDYLINLWRDSFLEESGVSSSRLIIVLDVTRADAWVKAVKALKFDYVAVQCCLAAASTRRDVEEGLVQSYPGNFTTRWVQWNFDMTNGSFPSARGWPTDEVDDTASLKPTYVVSRRWSDFSLRVPAVDDSELSGHWKANYFFLCRPCLAMSASCARRMRLVRILGAPGRRYRRLKMRWFPPSVLDTGHGFKLVRFHR